MKQPGSLFSGPHVIGSDRHERPPVFVKYGGVEIGPARNYYLAGPVMANESG